MRQREGLGEKGRKREERERHNVVKRGRQSLIKQSLDFIITCTLCLECFAPSGEAEIYNRSAVNGS